MARRALHGVPMSERDFNPADLRKYAGSKTVGFLGANPPTTPRFIVYLFGSIAGFVALGALLSRLG